MRHGGRLVLLVLTIALLAGCATSETLRAIAGAPPPESAARPTGETRWVLVQNPRFGATMAEPEYVWVEEDRIPGGVTTFLFGRSAVVAPAHVVPRHGPPPGDGQVSPLQGGPPLASRAATFRAGPRAVLRPEEGAAEGAIPRPSPPQVAARTPGVLPEPTRGYVIHVQAGLVVVDLTAADGIAKGSLLSIRRGGTPLTHPVTQEHLGKLEEKEVGTARVIELRERFSVAEIQQTRRGLEPQVKDRVFVTRP